MAEITLQAETGRPTGSRASNRLRASGKIPGTVYGLGAEAVTVTVDWRDLRHALTTEAGLNALIDLHVDGAGGQLAMVKDLQRHPVKRSVLHVDFLRVSRDVAIEVEVPITLEGEAELVLREGGTVDQTMFSLLITAKPADIPTELIADVSGLEIGGHVRVGDIALPPGVATEVDPEEAVVVGAAPMAEEVEEVAEGEEAEGEEGAEGEGEGAGAAEAPSDTAEGNE